MVKWLCIHVRALGQLQLDFDFICICKYKAPQFFDPNVPKLLNCNIDTDCDSKL